MKKIRNFVIGGIQQKVFNLVLVAILLIVAAYTAVILYQASSLNSLVADTTEKQRQSIDTISQQTMDGMISASMYRSTQLEASIADNLFRNMKNQVLMMGDYAEKLFSDPLSYPAQRVSPPDPEKESEVTLQLLTEEGVSLDDPFLIPRLGLAGNMFNIMESLYKRSQLNSCYIALPEGVMLLADDHPASKFSEDGSLIPIPIRERPWYQGAVETGGLFFTDVVTDVFTGQIGIMCALPVYVDGELTAVVGADLFLDSMAEAVAASGENGAFVCVLNEKGHVVFSPQKEGIFQVKPGSEAVDLREAGNEDLAAFIQNAMENYTNVKMVEADGTTYYMSGAPVETLGWTVLSAVSKEAADQPRVMMENSFQEIQDQASASFREGLSHSRQSILVLLLVILVLSLISALTLAKKIVKPLENITKKIGSLSGSNLQFHMEDAYRTGDEIEVLADSFADLSAKTVQYIDQVRKVTAEKERIGTELNMATAIQASQLPRLFPAFPDRPEFDIYATMTPAKEVGGDFYDFFLVDDDHICLVMADVSGKGVPAALFMMIARVLIKSHIQSGQSPAEALSNVNDQLCEGNEASLFVTVWLAVIEISTGKGVAVNAGHEHPVLKRTGGLYELVTYRHCPAVAVMEGFRFHEHTFELHPGDSIFVYTDGIPESINTEEQMFGADRLLEALNQDPGASPEELLPAVMASVHDFAAGAEQFDDITMLCLEYMGPEVKTKSNISKDSERSKP